MAQVQKLIKSTLYVLSFRKNSIERLPNTFKNIFRNKGTIPKISGLFPYNSGISGLKNDPDSGVQFLNVMVWYNLLPYLIIIRPTRVSTININSSLLDPPKQI